MKIIANISYDFWYGSRKFELDLIFLLKISKVSILKSELKGGNLRVCFLFLAL